MTAFDFLKTTVIAGRISKHLKDASEKKSLYSRLRLFTHGYVGAITPRELDLFEKEYEELDRQCRASIKEAKKKHSL